MPKPCDACYASSAVVYCRPDAAYLCSDCDGKVHGANKLASRHERVWMCEVCEAAPAVVTCKADAASLCVDCDTDIHSANPLAQRHERVPVQPLFESPCHHSTKPHHFEPHSHDLLKAEEGADAEAVSWLLPLPDNKVPIIRGSAAAAEAESEAHPPSLKLPQKKQKIENPADIFSDVDPFLDLDDAAVTGIQPDSLVPVLIPECSEDTLEPSFATKFDKRGFSYGTNPALSHSISCSSVDAAVVPDSSEISTSQLNSQGSQDFAAKQGMQQQAGGQLVDTTVDREARVMRYKEKRQKRKFEKTIRYASRKAYAESRPRIKGRFAKRTDSDVERMYGNCTVDSSFGVVPSF